MDPVQEQLDAYNSRDLEGFIKCFALDVVSENTAGTVVVTGIENLRQKYASLFANSPDLHCRLGQRIRVGAYVIDEEFVTGMNVPGAPLERHAAVIYHVVGGKIARIRALS